ncbi:HAD-IA family hydrolase [Paenibacillus sp. TRM 82003]|nr:HAD-IA family hydrolase [Paenibacillus sp. TRM 82003]
MFKRVVFDFDGTLADTRDVFVDLYNELAAERGYAPVQPEELGRISRMSIAERCRRLGVPLVRVPALQALALKRFAERMDAIGLFAGIPELLRELKGRGLPAGVLSSNDPASIREVLRRNGLASLFASIAPSSSLFGKDQALRKILKAEKLRPEEMLYVGDELRDVEACRKAGVPVAAATWGFDDAALLREAGPTFVAEQPMDILAFLQKA